MKSITATPENFDKNVAVTALVRQKAFLKTDAELARDLAEYEWLLARHEDGELSGDVVGQRLYLEWSRDAVLTEQAVRLRRPRPAGQDRQFDDRALIDEIKGRVSLVHVLASCGVLLRGRDTAWRACCPFHKGDNPYALQVTDTGPHGPGFYFCHVCLRHGDVIDALIWLTEFSFHEAVRALAKVAKIEVPTDWGSPPRDDHKVAVRVVFVEDEDHG